jgi:hypothetical protein
MTRTAHLAAIAAAERVGAEKMRERVASFVEEYLPPQHFDLGWLGKELAEAIRALPLPGAE